MDPPRLALIACAAFVAPEGCALLASKIVMWPAEESEEGADEGEVIAALVGTLDSIRGCLDFAFGNGPYAPFGG